MSAADSLVPGSTFAGYRVERLLGSGGMGAVYIAMHPRLPKRVALKLLHPGLTSDRFVRARFEQEAETVARLEHPNIVAVEDRGRVGDQLWMAMRYITGSDADAALKSGPLEPGRAVYIVTETAEALDYAHELGVLHRDVKPANILLERRGSGRRERVLLADFGIAKALAESSELTTSGTMVASLPYAAPEQFGDGELDERIDVYALGCTLYRLLTGAPPYPGNTLHQLWFGHVQASIPKPSVTRPDLPSGFDGVIETALAKQPDDRFRTCGEFADAAIAALRTPVGRPARIVFDRTREPLPETTIRRVERRPAEPAPREPAPTPATPPEPKPVARPVVEATDTDLQERKAREALASVRTRLAAVQHRSKRLPEAYSALLREFAAPNSEDLAGSARLGGEQIADADAVLRKAAAALDAGEVPTALELTRTVRAHLAAAERHVDAVVGRLSVLRAVRDDPKQRLDAVRAQLRDTRELAAHLGVAAEWEPVLAEQSAKVDAIAANLRGRHPDYWSYVRGIDDVAGVVTRTAESMRRRTS